MSKPDSRKSSAADRIEGLDAEQAALLEDLFYRQHKGTIGVRALYELLRQDDERQESSLAGLRRGQKGWLPWRTVRAWYNAQETNQRHRRAKTASKTLVNVPDEADLVPFKFMQLDTLVFAKPGAAAGSTGLPDGRYRVIYNLVDQATNYNWLYAGTVAPNTAHATDAMKEWIDAVREHYGGWPERTVVRVDGGPEYKPLFREAVTRYEPQIRFQQNPAYNPNSNAVVEGSMSIFRRLAKRHAENLRSTRAPPPGKSYLSYWFGNAPGKQGEILAELNMLMNTRPVSSIGFQTPADVLEAFMDPQLPGRDAIIDKAVQSRLRSANARRSAATITKYRRGDRVRLISDHYVETAGQRGNKTKQAPPWSKALWTISSVQGGKHNVPKYRLHGKGDEWFLHHRLQRVEDGLALPPPSAVVAQDPDYDVQKTVGPHVYYRGFPAAELGANRLPPALAVGAPAVAPLRRSARLTQLPPPVRVRGAPTLRGGGLSREVPNGSRAVPAWLQLAPNP